MTVLGENPVQVVTGIPRCSVMVAVADLISLPAPLAPFGLVPCALPAAGWYAGQCPCRHVRDGWLCEVHAEMAGEGGCRACVELAEDPHDCPLPLSRVTPGGAS